MVGVDKTMGKSDTNEPIQDEQQISRLIAAVKGSTIAAAWWEFKMARLAGSGSQNMEDATKNCQPVPGGE